MNNSKTQENKKLVGGRALISEKTLKRLLCDHYNDGFVIISADRVSEDLRQKIVSKRYAFLPVNFGYLEDGKHEYDYDSDIENTFEKFFAVFPFDNKNKKTQSIADVITDCKKWCAEYSQDSIMVNDGENVPYYWERNSDSKINVFAPVIKEWRPIDLLEKYSSEFLLHNKGIKDQQGISIKMYTDVQPPPGSWYYEMERTYEGEICMRIDRWEKCIENGWI